jgi:hypothetical protein
LFTVARFGPTGKKGCRYDSLKEFRNGKTIVERLPLERFVGPDGLMMLFSLLAAGNLPRGEVLELAKRVQIPGYELARVAGIDFLKRCDAVPGTRVLPAIGNPRNDCFDIEQSGQCQATNVTCAYHVNFRHTEIP